MNSLTTLKEYNMTITTPEALTAAQSTYPFKTSLYFPLVWLQLSERDYHKADGHRFSKKLSALMGRFPFGASWDLNPPHFICIEIVPDASNIITMVARRVLGHMKRQEALGVIKSFGYYSNPEDAENAVAAVALAK